MSNGNNLWNTDSPPTGWMSFFPFELEFTDKWFLSIVNTPVFQLTKQTTKQVDDVLTFADWQLSISCWRWLRFVNRCYCRSNQHLKDKASCSKAFGKNMFCALRFSCHGLFQTSKLVSCMGIFSVHISRSLWFCVWHMKQLRNTWFTCPLKVCVSARD